MPHRFQAGQTVEFTPSLFDRGAKRGRYRVVRCLPPEGRDNQYRVASVVDGHERVVRESQLA
jgi:hypothetical protein